jgi:hypothetical protein
MTGTADAGHMREALDVFEFRLGRNEVKRIERLNKCSSQRQRHYGRCRSL